MSNQPLKVSFASLSLGASVDQQTGSMSVFEVIEEVRAPQLPVQLPSLVISLSLQKLIPAEFVGKMLIHLLTPDGKQHMIGNGELKIPAEQHRMKAIFRYGGFPVAVYGVHQLVLSWVDSDNQKVCESVLDFEAVRVAAPAKSPAGPEQGGGSFTH